MKSIKHALFGLFGIAGLTVSMFGLFKVPFAESAAKEHWRPALAAILLILSLIAAAIGLFIYTFDANNFKSQIFEYVKVHKQRDLTLEGDIKVTFFPKLGLNTGRMILSERNSAQRFAAIDNMRLYVAWLPLLRKQLEIDRVTLDGVQARVVRYKDGTSNLDDLLLHDENLESIRFDIDGVSVSHSSVEFQDEMEGVHFSVRDLNIDTGRLTDSLPTNVAAGFRLESDNPHIGVNAKLTSHLFFNRKAEHYEFANFEGSMDGEAAGISKLALKFEGSMNGFPAQGMLKVDKLLANATGQLNGHAVDARLELPQLQISRDGISGSKLNLVATASQADEIISGNLLLPAFTLSSNQLKSAESSAEFTLKQADRGLQARLSSPLDANLATEQWEFPNLSARFTVSHPNLSSALDGKAHGKLHIDWQEQQLNASLDGTVGDSDVNASLAMKNFQQPSYVVDIGVKQLDLDRYLTAGWSKHLFEDNTELDFSALKNPKLRGTLRVDELKLAKIKLNKLILEASADQANLQLDPVNADLYGGSLSGSLAISTQNGTQLNLKQRLSNIQLGSLLNDLYGTSHMSGKTNMSMSLSTTGNTPATLRQALAGNFELSATRGALHGFNLPQALSQGKSLLGIPDGQLNVTGQDDLATDFSELKASFNITQGQASATDILLKAPQLAAKAGGRINLANCDLDMQLESTINPALKRASHGELAELRGMTIPAKLSGHCSAPTLSLDLLHASGGNIVRLSKANLARLAAASSVPASNK